MVVVERHPQECTRANASESAKDGPIDWNTLSPRSMLTDRDETESIVVLFKCAFHLMTAKRSARHPGALVAT